MIQRISILLQDAEPLSTDMKNLSFVDTYLYLFLDYPDDSIIVQGYRNAVPNHVCGEQLYDNGLESNPSEFHSWLGSHAIASSCPDQKEIKLSSPAIRNQQLNFNFPPFFLQ